MFGLQAGPDVCYTPTPFIIEYNVTLNFLKFDAISGFPLPILLTIGSALLILSYIVEACRGKIIKIHNFVIGKSDDNQSEEGKLCKKSAFLTNI